MQFPFEAERRLGNQHLFWRGLATIIVAAIVVGVLIAKSNGDLDEHVEVKAMLEEVGDGLPVALPDDGGIQRSHAPHRARPP